MPGLARTRFSPPNRLFRHRLPYVRAARQSVVRQRCLASAALCRYGLVRGEREAGHALVYEALDVVVRNNGLRQTAGLAPRDPLRSMPGEVPHHTTVKPERQGDEDQVPTSRAARRTCQLRAWCGFQDRYPRGTWMNPLTRTG